MRSTLWTAVALLALVSACMDREQAPGEGRMFRIESPAFGMNEEMPEKYTGDGEDVSPPLVLGEAPEGTKELAIICDDPDAPTPEPWVHWVAWGIPPETREIPEGAPPAGGMREGKNGWGSGKTIGYRGPKPPGGTHRYFFRVYALDTRIELPEGATKKRLLGAMKDHVLGEAVLIGLYTAK